MPSGFDSMDDTLPTWTPRIFTLASGFITRPARSEITVTGTVSVKLPRNRPDRERDDRDDRHHGPQTRQRAHGIRLHRLLPYPDRLKLPLEP